MTPSTTSLEWHRRPSRIAVIGPLLFGVAAAAAAVGLADLSGKALLGMLLIVGMIPVIAITRQIKAILLIGWILSLAYFRVFFPIDSMAGFQGFYATAADGLFAVLLIYWLVEAALTRRAQKPLGPPVWWLFVPFVAVCGVSAMLAARPDWAAYDLFRSVNVVLIMVYCRYNLGKREWWICLCGIGLSIAGQSTMGIAQVAHLIGNYQLADWEPFRRAAGTLSHANLLAGYLLLLSPPFLALAVVLRRPALRIACALVGVVALAAIGLTLSRAPWVIAVVEVGGLCLIFLYLGVFRLKAVIGCWSIAVVLAAAAVFPFRESITRRFESNLQDSIDFRLRMNEVAGATFLQNPILGVGLSNLPLYIRRYEFDFSKALDAALAGEPLVIENGGSGGAEPAQERGFHWMMVPHNLYFILLSESGGAGLLAFVSFLAIAFLFALRNVRLLTGPAQAVSIGFVVGMAGVFIQCITDYALWMDPVFYSYALVVGMVVNAPYVLREGPRA